MKISFCANLAFQLRSIVLFGILMVFILPVSGQLNILVGYGLSYEDASGINSLISEHNAANSWYKVDMDDVALGHGLYLGLRYDMGAVKTLMAYRTSGKEVKAEGIPPGETESFQRRLSVRNNVVSLGLESSFDWFNWGATVDYNFHKISSEITGISDPYEVQDDGFLSSHVYLNFSFLGSQQLGLTLQPYVQFPLSDFSLDNLSEELNVAKGRKHQSTTFGLTVILVNGPQ